MIGYGLDRGGPKDSETAPNSFLTKINGNVFWRFAPELCFLWTWEIVSCVLLSLLTTPPWATLVQNVVFSYVLPYVVKFGEPRWDKWLAWGENIYHFKHSSKFWLRGYSRLSCKGPLKLLNKRLRPKHEYCNNSVIFRPILMRFGVQLSYGPPFSLAKFQQGHKGQRPEGRKVKGQNFKKLVEAIFTII